MLIKRFYFEEKQKNEQRIKNIVTKRSMLLYDDVPQVLSVVFEFHKNYQKTDQNSRKVS